MNYKEVTSKLYGVFMLIDEGKELRTLSLATENVIKDHHTEIIEYLENIGTPDTYVKLLKKQLDIP